MAYPVRRAPLSLEDLFDPPAGITPLDLVDASSGGTPRLRTTCWLFNDREYLYALFKAVDEPGAVATYRRHDDPVYEEDAFEIFLAPADPTRYFEIELSPLGTVFDAAILNPDGQRDTMTTDVDWECQGLWTAVKTEVAGVHCQVEALLAIPFEGVGTGTPARGDCWRANLFRIDRGQSKGDEFSAWRPTHRTPADFHVPAAFGELCFE